MPNLCNSATQSTCPLVLIPGSVTTMPSTSCGTPLSIKQSPTSDKGQPTDELKYISKYLGQYIPSVTPKTKESSASKSLWNKNSNQCTVLEHDTRMIGEKETWMKKRSKK